MNRRPLVISVISVLFILLGCGILVGAVMPLLDGPLSRHELLDSFYVALTAVLALVSGIFMFKGKSWARWLCLIWMAAHVVLSLWHPWLQLIIHTLMLLVLLYVLFWSRSASYFKS
jgi:hypothetical protein